MKSFRIGNRYKEIKIAINTISNNKDLLEIIIQKIEAYDNIFIDNRVQDYIK
ncbi:MAG: hypothetical protein MJA31_10580 [Clostridia bacterium]|nr:hypothetical protein [Clostridia bacterium]